MRASFRESMIAVLGIGFSCSIASFPAVAQDAAPAHRSERIDGRAWVTGSDVALREAAAGAVANGCIVFESKVRQDAGGPNACTVLSGGGTTNAAVASGGCAIVIDSYISNFGCNGPGPAGELKAWQMHFGSDGDLPAGISGAALPACTVTQECHDLGYFGPCIDTDSDFIPDTCLRVWFESGIEPNVVFDISYLHNVVYLAAATTSNPSPAVDDGSEFYAMSMRILVDEGTAGTLAIPFLDLEESFDNFVFMADGSEPPIGKLIGATIEVPESEYCCGNGVCSLGGPVGTCAAMGLPTASGPCLGDCDSNGVDDACEGMADCNGNGIGDRCDTASGSSPDCNRNRVPDECESQADCNDNGITDICEVFDKDANDCNWNNVPDSCDIASGGEPDENGNGVIDYCELRNRFIYFDAPAGEVAIRVKFLNLDLFEGFNGGERWLGAAVERLPGGQTESFWASEVGCDPVLTTWPAGERLYVFGSSVVPNSDYEIRFADADCLASGLESCMSAPIERSTWVWGDVYSPYLGHPSPAQPNVFDMTALVDTFKDVGFKIEYTRARISGNIPNVSSAISFADINACVEANKGRPYPYDGPDPCP